MSMIELWPSFFSEKLFNWLILKRSQDIFLLTLCNDMIEKVQYHWFTTPVRCSMSLTFILTIAVGSIPMEQRKQAHSAWLATAPNSAFNYQQYLLSFLIWNWMCFSQVNFGALITIVCVCVCVCNRNNLWLTVWNWTNL